MKRKIFIVIDSLGPGGAQRQVIEYLKYADRETFEFKVINLDKHYNTLEKEIEELETRQKQNELFTKSVPITPSEEPISKVIGSEPISKVPNTGKTLNDSFVAGGGKNDTLGDGVNVSPTSVDASTSNVKSTTHNYGTSTSTSQMPVALMSALSMP